MTSLQQQLLKNQHNIPNNNNMSFKSSSINKLSIHSSIKIQKRKAIKNNSLKNSQVVIFTSVLQGNSSYFNQSVKHQQFQNIKLELKKSLSGSYQQFYSIHQEQVQRFPLLQLKNQEKLEQIKQDINVEFKTTQKVLLVEGNSQAMIDNKYKSMINSGQLGKDTSLFGRSKMNQSIKFKKKQQQISFKEKFYKYFGQGVNNQILYLSNYVINLLLINILLDILFRTYLFWVCLNCYFLSTYKTYYFYPILAEIVARFLTFFTLIKMSFDEKYEISVTFQKSISDKEFVDLEFDKIFRRQYSYKNARSTILKCMIPPQLLILVIEASQFTWKKIYILVNLIFKSFENILVLLAFGLVLRQSYHQSDQVPFYILEVSAIVITQQIIRYSINYLLIHLISRKK